MWEGIGKAGGWRPEGPSAKEMFENERAAEAALAVLLDAKVGRIVTRTPPEEE